MCAHSVCMYVHGANIVWVRVNVHTILSSLSTWPAKAIALWFNALTQLWVYTHANTRTSECVCYHASCYSPRLYVENIKALLSFLCHLVHVYCVNFIENTLFRNSGNICWPPLPSLLLDGLLKDKKRQWCLCFNMTIVCRSSNKSFILTGSSLDMVNASYASWLKLCWASS